MPQPRHRGEGRTQRYSASGQGRGWAPCLPLKPLRCADLVLPSKCTGSSSKHELCLVAGPVILEIVSNHTAPCPLSHACSSHGCLARALPASWARRSSWTSCSTTRRKAMRWAPPLLPRPGQQGLLHDGTQGRDHTAFYMMGTPAQCWDSTLASGMLCAGWRGECRGGLKHGLCWVAGRVQGEFYNYSGCGNTVNCNHPVVRRFIVDCLR